MKESEFYFNDVTVDDCNQQTSIYLGNKEPNHKKESSNEDKEEEEEIS